MPARHRHTTRPRPDSGVAQPLGQQADSPSRSSSCKVLTVMLEITLLCGVVVESVRDRALP